MKNPKKEDILIGALLHDIGKIFARGNTKKDEKTKQNNFVYAHEREGYYLINNINNTYINREKTKECIGYHHSQKNKIVYNKSLLTVSSCSILIFKPYCIKKG
jgi:HD-GYP domain-containing protein (c-di-GMP phosphodiesterase class II)